MEINMQGSWEGLWNEMIVHNYIQDDKQLAANFDRKTFDKRVDGESSVQTVETM